MGNIIREEPFPEDTEGRLNNLLNIVNTELKSLSLLHLSREHAYTGSELYSKVRQTLQGKGYLPSPVSFSKYCSDTLYPIGTVAKEEIIADNGITRSCAYRLTDAGEKYGLPLAAFALDWAIKHKQSLFSTLGSTISPGKSRAPFNRAKMLEILAETSDITESSLGNRIDISPSAIVTHCRALQRQGLVQFASVGKYSEHRGSHIYEFLNNERKPQTVESRVTLTEQVYTAIKELQRANYHTIAEKVVYPHPSNISRVLSALESQGILKRSSPWIVKEKRSSISITPQGRAFVTLFLSPVKRALSSEHALQELSQSSLSPLMEPELLRTHCQEASRLYASVSPNINKKDIHMRIDSLAAWMKKQGKGISSKECAEKEKISECRAGQILTEMESLGILSSEIDDDRVKWYRFKESATLTDEASSYSGGLKYRGF